MAGTIYTIDFTNSSVDPTKAPFQINPGGFDGPAGTNTHTSLNLFGEGFLQYGQRANENFLWLLENFASPGWPPNPTIGQLWFDTSVNLLKVFDMSHSWSVVAGGVPPPKTFLIVSANTGTSTFYVSGDATPYLTAGGQFIVQGGANAGTYTISSAVGSVTYISGTDQTAIVVTSTVPSSAGGGTIVSAPSPTSPVTGELWFNVIEGSLYVYTGAAWSKIFSGNATGDIDMLNTHKVINLPDPTNTDDAANKNYVDTQISTLSSSLSSSNLGLQSQIDQKVTKTGDTMTGTLVFSSGGISLNNATNINLIGGSLAVSNNGSVSLSVGSILTLGQDPSSPLEAATKQYVDSRLYSLPQATTSAIGGVVLATGSEAIAGTNTQKAITPVALQSVTNLITTEITSRVPYDLLVVPYSSSISFDFATSRNFSITLTGQVSILSPTNLITGQSGVIYIIQDGTGSRMASFSTSTWKFENGTVPALSTAAGSIDVLVYEVYNTNTIVASLLKKVS
jgi:hypothetical protein